MAGTVRARSLGHASAATSVADGVEQRPSSRVVTYQKRTTTGDDLNDSSSSSSSLSVSNLAFGNHSSSVSFFKGIVSSWRTVSKNSTTGPIHVPPVGHRRPSRRATVPVRQASSKKVRTRPPLGGDLMPKSLEGTLSFRKGKISGASRSWKECYVVLNLTDGGSISCYKEMPPQPQQSASSIPSASPLELRSLLNPLQPSALASNRRKKNKETSSSPNPNSPQLLIPTNISWIAKNIENDSYGFVVEIPNDAPYNALSPTSPAGQQPIDNSNIIDEMERAREHGKPLRVYFKCSRHDNEKVLWLEAFRRLNRLSSELRRKKGILTHLMSPPTILMSHSRIRSNEGDIFTQEGLALGLGRFTPDHRSNNHLNLEQKIPCRKGKGAKEYLVYPMFAYPNRWMTNFELHQEMIKPSEVFHDLRQPSDTGNNDGPGRRKEIGMIKVEVLQCLGLPRLDRASETDAVGYVVCGSAAFATDVIWNRLNPIWLPKCRRACILPIYHAYADLFVGIFDDDGKKEKDDFAGRVVISLSRLRPGSVYDVTLPLRLSANVYTRRPRGAVRLRLSLEWNSERDALLSYLPKTIRPPQSRRPDDDVTVLCADEKAFRNIATTVHGVHMPGRFSFQQWRSTLREGNFVRIVCMLTARKLLLDTILWKHPHTSFGIFLVWMRCIYLNTFSAVPAYMVMFLFLIMVRNYVVFGMDGPVQNGFIPPSFEEMFHALVKGGDSKSISPMEMAPPDRSTVEVYNPQPKTHVPRGKWLFHLLGYQEADQEATSEAYDMEFPFSRGLHYPKFSVKECLVHKHPVISRSKKRDQNHDFHDEPETTSLDGVPGWGKFLSLGSKSDIQEQENQVGVSERSTTTCDGSEMASDRRVPHIAESDLESTLWSMDDGLPSIPEQDIDIETKTTKKLSDDLMDIQANVHRMTFHLFNDRTHVIKHPNACYFGYAKKSEKWRRTNVKTELERLLNVGQYSSANPVVARVGMYVSPMISAAQSALCLSRALYNVATWRDPFLSFWVSLILFMIVVLLSIFPWRLFFFGIGVVVVGPQNWLLRVLHEKGRLPDKINQLLQARLQKSRSRNSERDEVDSKNAASLPRDQPIICCHSPDGSPPLMLSHDDVDPREIHHVSVPSSQLTYQRFYDWPPEPQYAKVRHSEK